MPRSTATAWDRFNELLVARCGYLLLAVATVLSVAGGVPEPASELTTLAIAGAAAAWIYVAYTRLPPPRREPRGRLAVFFVGVLLLASVLMARQPIFFIFMISGFFYASALRPLPLAFAGVGATSILVNPLIAGLPATPAAWTFYLAIIGIQTAVIGAGVVVGEKMTEQSEERRRDLARLETALAEN